ncbi:MAG: response regulator [Alkalimonas sp.]|nr:response regulator [Alkalimonas sp.]
MNRIMGLSLLLALLFTTFLSFFQVHHQVRHDHQQQLTTMSQLLAKATQLLLQDAGEQDINSLFSEAQHQALFPIYSITLLNAERSVLSSTGLSTLIEEPEASWFGNEHQFHRLHHDRVLSSQPMTLSAEPTEWGYLLIEAGSPEFPWRLWFWQMLIWLMVPCLLLFVLWLVAQRQKNFLQMGFEDIKQLALRWMDGDPDVRLARQHPLSSEFNQLFDRVQQQQQEHEAQRASLAEQVVQLQQGEHAQASQAQQLQQVQQKLIEQEQQFTELLTQLAAVPDQWLRQGLTQCVGAWQRQTETTTPSKLLLADWIASQMPSWRSCPRTSQQLQVFEDLKAADFTIGLQDAELALCCQSLIQLCCRFTKQSQLALHWQLQPELGQLQLSIVMKGESLAEDMCLLLESAPDQLMPNAPLEIYCIARACQRLNAKLSISCLQELGSSFLLECPVQLSSCAPPSRFERLYCFKQSSTLAPALMHNLKALTHQLHVFQQWNELPSEASRAGTPLLVLMPSQSPDDEISQWQSLLAQPQVIMLTDEHELADWQRQIQVPTLSLPLSSQEVMRQLKTLAEPAERSFRLLIVDDNETNQAFLQAVLASYPFDLVAEYTGKSALERCSKQHFDLILMDIQLPDMSGVEVTRQLRARPDFESTTILAFTAHALPEEVERFKQAGMNDVVIKPLDSKKVATLLSWCHLQPDAATASPKSPC